MARRSPSPSNSSKRSRRDDDHYDRRRRDDERSHRRRSRSRSPDRRYRDRDSQRARDRSRDRRDHDHYRSGYRDSSRERRRSRDRGVRDYRDRSRDRDYRHRRDPSRDRDRRRRDDSADSRRSGRRRDSRERGRNRDGSDKKESAIKATSNVTDEEKKKAERLAKLAAWKQKQQVANQAKQQKEQLETTGGTRGLLEAIDKAAAASPTNASSPQSPATPAEPASPAPYAGKWDPKRVQKKAASNSASSASKLGIDIMLPDPNKASASSTNNATDVKANKSAAPGTSSSASSLPLKGRGNLSGFGLAGKASQEADKPTTKKGLDFEEEEGSRMKLEKLPTPPPANAAMDEGAALTNGTKEDEDDEDVDMEGDTEEEAAAAARAAAEKREERLQAENLVFQIDEPNEATTNGATDANGDMKMEDAPAQPADVEMANEEEDVDPLDAFMTGLADDAYTRPKLAPKIKAAQEPQAMFGDDEPQMTAVEQEDDILPISNKKKKKDIPTVDHTKINYEPFQKNFYVEPSDLAALDEAEVADLRLELDGIKVRGTDIPKPATKWSQCGLSNQILDVINGSSLGYEKPTPIQAQAIPTLEAGRNLIGVAKTGSGKTLAFLLPMFRHIKAQRALKVLDGPIALIMTPTRELCTQIGRDCRPFCKALDLRVVCAFGGEAISGQIAQLKASAHIVVCTPGRMIDLLAANSGRVVNLRRVTYVVLDEADRMFDLGFEPQVMRILLNIRPDRQLVLFSATFPRQMESLARKVLTKPVEIVVGGRSAVPEQITQLVEVRTEDSKFLRLLEILGKWYSDESHEDDRTLIFVESQNSADKLLSDLMRKAYPALSLHGGKDQIDRASTIADFKAGCVPVLVSTSISARGLDVKQLKLVINYDAPNHLEDYVHRAGRTGRAGNTGTAFTFITPEQERYSVDIAKALKQSGQPVPEDVQKLVDNFLEKVKAGKEKAGASGFGGKGLDRLDQERDATRLRERRVYKTGDDADEEEKEESKADDSLFTKAASAVQSADAPAPQVSSVHNEIDSLDPGKITVHRTEKPSADASTNPLERVNAAAASIAGRLGGPGVARPGQSLDNRGPDAGAYHATLEINGFPQRARWAVTNRTNIAKVLEATGTSITTKGNFYAQGKEPQPGEAPKLYILVEGDTEIAVTNAMRELMRLLKEGTIAAADSESRAPASGRYSVV